MVKKSRKTLSPEMVERFLEIMENLALPQQSVAQQTILPQPQVSNLPKPTFIGSTQQKEFKILGFYQYPKNQTRGFGISIAPNGTLLISPYRYFNGKNGLNWYSMDAIAIYGIEEVEALEKMTKIAKDYFKNSKN